MAQLPPLSSTSLPAGLVLVDLGAERCAPCRAMLPVLEALAEEYRGYVRMFAVDCDAEPALAAHYDVRAMPTLVLLRDGREIGRIVGARPRSYLAEMLDRAIATP